MTTWSIISMVITVVCIGVQYYFYAKAEKARKLAAKQLREAHEIKVKKHGWTLFREKMPDPEVCVLLLCTNGQVLQGYQNDKGGFQAWSRIVADDDLTAYAWQPLPVGIPELI